MVTDQAERQRGGRGSEIQSQFGKYGYIVEADIKGFFDNMDHDWLLRMLGSE